MAYFSGPISSVHCVSRNPLRLHIRIVFLSNRKCYMETSFAT